MFVVHMSISPWSGARGLQRLASLKYYYVQKWQFIFNLGINAAKHTHHMKKSFKLKLFKIEFRTKKSASASVYLPREWS